MDTTPGKQDNLIWAAGGLVWADSPEGRRLAIVHRKRYGDEWTLPKGKREPQDINLLKTAEREVFEETKLAEDKITVTGFHDAITYITDKGPKVVLFWNMIYTETPQLLSQKINDKNGEVDEMRWVTVDEALSLLRYPKERALLQVNPFIPWTWPKDSFMGKFLAAARRTYNYRACKRLIAESGPFEIELKRKIAGGSYTPDPKSPGQPDKRQRLAAAALQHIERIRDALETGEIEQGWRHLHEAKRLYVCMDDDPQSIHDNAIAILNEGTQKLSSWRKTTLTDLLAGKPHSVKDSIAPYELSLALKILYEDFDNTYDNIQRVQYQYVILIGAGLIALGILYFFLPNVCNEVPMDNSSLLLSIMAFGALGGIFSSLYTLSKEFDPKKKIPDQILNSWVTLIRPLVGAMSALAILQFVMSGILNLNIGGEVNVNILLAVAFASGMTERIIIASVGTIAKDK